MLAESVIEVRRKKRGWLIARMFSVKPRLLSNRRAKIGS